MIIDAHTHILSREMIVAREDYRSVDRWFGALYASPRARLATGEDLIASMDRAGIEASVAFGFAFASSELCHRCNDYVLECAARWPGRIIPFAVVSPMDSEVACIEAERCLAGGALGIGELMPDGQAIDLQSDRLAPLLQVAQSHSVPLMLHANELVGHSYPGKGHTGPEAAYAFAADHPGLRLILSHWGGGLAFYELMTSTRTALANVWYDTAASTLLYDDRVFSHVMAWAPDKVLFGTDYPLLTQRRFLQRVLALGLEDTQRSALFSANLLRTLGHPDDRVPGR